MYLGFFTVIIKRFDYHRHAKLFPQRHSESVEGQNLRCHEASRQRSHTRGSKGEHPSHLAQLGTR
jgi:hypothetical protein